ncbi:hypothetical protein [Marinobacter salicampi]|uniref:hypothetical protein n=1 Tax=Marinobacter salicampi TaxID=435907 RepID=UPI00140A5B70|nr:hypothetical protein [Marinobacter salicampi]
MLNSYITTFVVNDIHALVINLAVGDANLDSPCLICNMSNEPVFVENILVDLETSAGTYSARVTDIGEEAAPTKLGSTTRQGPLDSGQCLEIQKFRELLERTAEAGQLKLIDAKPNDPEVTLKSLTVTIISIYGPEDNPFGAYREFELSYDNAGPVRITPTSIDTRRLNSRQGKKRAKQLNIESI